MANETNITYSRELIRQKLLEKLDQIYREKGLVLDLTNSSFGSFVTNLLSVVAFDATYYTNFMYGESTLTTATLNSTIQNWANYIDYQPRLATPSRTSLDFYFYYENSFVCDIIPFTHLFYSGGVPFTLLKPIRVMNTGGTIEIREMDEATNTYTVKPFKVSFLDTGQRVFSFATDVINIYTKEYDFKIPPLRNFEMYDIPISLGVGENLISVEMFVDAKPWTRKPLILSTSSEEVFDIYYSNTSNSIVVRTGNNLYGKQVSGDDILVRLYVCNGTAGNVQSNTIVSGPNLYDVSGSYIVEYFVTNPLKATGGSNQETIAEIKVNAPKELRRRYRNVSYQDYIDDLKVNVPQVEYADIVLKRSDNATNDINVYVLLRDDYRWIDANGQVIDYTTDPTYRYFIPTSTISVDISTLTPVGTKVIFPYQTILKSVFSHDSTTNYVCPLLLFIDDTRDTWYGYMEVLNGTLNFEKGYDIYSSNIDLGGAINLPTLLNGVNCVVSKVEYTFSTTGVTKIYFDITCSVVNDAITKQQLVIRYKNGNTQVLNPTNVTGSLPIGQNLVKYEYTYTSIEDVRTINYVEVRNYYTTTINGNTVELLVNAWSSTVYLLKAFTDYGWVVRDTQTNKSYLMDIPVIEKSYWDSLDTYSRTKFMELIMSIYNMVLLDEKKRMLNTYPHLKFVRTVGSIYNITYSPANLDAMGIVYGHLQLQQVNIPIGSCVLISDPMLAINDPLNDYVGTAAYYSGINPVTNTKVYEYKRVSQSTIANISGTKYVLVDTRWTQYNKLTNTLRLKVEVDIFVENTSIPGLKDKYRNYIMTYINEKDPEETLRFSDLIQYLYTVPGTKFVRMVAPKHDFVYKYDKKELLEVPTKELLLTYVPEKIHCTYSDVVVNIKSSIQY